MSNPTGGKTKQPDARTVAVKMEPEVRGLMLDLCHRRVLANKPYDETTYAGVIRDAIRMLHAIETGAPNTPVLPTVDLEPTAPDPSDLQLQKEYAAFTHAEGVSNLPWDQFLTIRKLRVQKGAWKYGPNH